MGSVEGKVALVTGASRGIGAAIAARLASAGADVAITARTLEPDPSYRGSLRETADAIKNSGGRCTAIRANLADHDDRVALVEQVREAVGPIDILVNNAAVTYLSPITELTSKRVALMLEMQVTAPYELTRLVVPEMYEKGAGWILNISSRAAIHPPGPPWDPIYEKGWTAYGMCKAALERFTTALAAEGHRHGLRANALAPLDNVATPGATGHDLVADFALEDPNVMAEAALALVEGDLTGRIALSQPLLEELNRMPSPLPAGIG